MVCKCGATVKASGGVTPRMTRFRADSTPFLKEVREMIRAQGARPRRPHQDCGTIDVRSNGDTIASGVGAWRSPGRSNSIRRSKAVERIIG